MQIDIIKSRDLDFAKAYDMMEAAQNAIAECEEYAVVADGTVPVFASLSKEDVKFLKSFIERRAIKLLATNEALTFCHKMRQGDLQDPRPSVASKLVETPVQNADGSTTYEYKYKEL